MNPIFKKFNFKLFKFLVRVLLVIFLLLVIGYVKEKYQFNLNKEFLNNKNVFIGDSHIQKSIDPSKFKQTINIAQVSESFYYSFFKLKYLIDQKIQIKSVYFGVGYHSFSSYYDKYTFGKFSEDIRARYFYILPFSENLSFGVNHFKTVLDFSKSLISKNSTFHAANDLNHTFLGGHTNFFVNFKLDTSFIKRRAKEQYYNENRLCKISQVNSSYFDSIVSICKRNNIKLTLVSTPVHPYYDKCVPKFFKNYFLKKCKMSGCKLILFDSKHFTDDCFYRDGDHVTKKGGQKITSEFSLMPFTGLIIK
jgi:hypothetical protein